MDEPYGGPHTSAMALELLRGLPSLRPMVNLSSSRVICFTYELEIFHRILALQALSNLSSLWAISPALLRQMSKDEFDWSLLNTYNLF